MDIPVSNMLILVTGLSPLFFLLITIWGVRWVVKKGFSEDRGRDGNLEGFFPRRDAKQEYQFDRLVSVNDKLLLLIAEKDNQINDHTKLVNKLLNLMAEWRDVISQVIAVSRSPITAQAMLAITDILQDIHIDFLNFSGNPDLLKIEALTDRVRKVHQILEPYVNQSGDGDDKPRHS